MESKLFVSFYLMYNRSIDVALLAKYGKCFKLSDTSRCTLAPGLISFVVSPCYCYMCTMCIGSVLQK